MTIIPEIENFDETQIPVEGDTATFRARASYVWNKLVAVISSFNISIGAMNTVADEIDTKAQIVANQAVDGGYSQVIIDDFLVALDNAKLGVNDTAADSVKLGGELPAYYLSTNGDGSGLTNVGVGNNTTVTSIGYSALANNTGAGNSSFGNNSLYRNTTGINNCAFASAVLYQNTTGSNNTGLGNFSLYPNTTGSNNTGLGNQSGYSGYQITTDSNNIVLGNANITAIRAQVTSITGFSDKRDKALVENVTNGLSFIKELRPVWYNWDQRAWYKEIDKNGNVIFDSVPDGSLMSSTRQVGFLAQDIESAELSENHKNFVVASFEEKNDTHMITEGKIIPFLVDAVQTLSKKIDAQQIEINTLKGL